MWVGAQRARGTAAIPGFLWKARVCPQLAPVPRNPKTEKMSRGQPTRSAPLMGVISAFGNQHVVIFTARRKRKCVMCRKTWKSDHDEGGNVCVPRCPLLKGHRCQHQKCDLGVVVPIVLLPQWEKPDTSQFSSSGCGAPPGNQPSLASSDLEMPKIIPHPSKH